MRFSIFTLLILLSSIADSQQKISVSTQHNNNSRTGWNYNETKLNHSLLTSGKFGCIGNLSVDDEVYAQPLVVGSVSIGNYSGSVLYVATVNNTVYAFNAQDPSSAAALWQVSLNPFEQRAPNIFDLQDNTYGQPCGGNYRDFSGNMGIVGTPVIDTATATLYVCTKTIDANGVFYAFINALDIKTGKHRIGSPRQMQAQVLGTGDGSVNGYVKYDAKFQNQRPALLLYNKILYVASASHCDWGPYHGWILGYDATTLGLKYKYNVTPNGWAGGIWMAGQGPSVGDDGNIYLATGNGTTSPSNTDLKGGRSESLIKLSPQLSLLDWFTPSNYAYLDQYDLDYGCDGVLMVPNSHTTISGSKEGLSYVVDYTKMGRYNATNSHVKDTLEFNPSKTGYVHIHGSPVYARFSTGEFVYAWAETFKLRQFTYNRPSGTFYNNFKQGLRNLDNGMPGAMLSVSSRGTDTATAIVWASFPKSGNANNQVRRGTFAAYNAADVSLGELWSSDAISTDVVGKFAKFNSPTIANGKVYLATFSKNIKVYGALCANALSNLLYSNGSGLKAEYFSNSSAAAPFANASLTRLDETINFNWGNQAPAAGISKDTFKIRWTGKIVPLTNATYTLYITASDGVRLYINNNLMLDSWSDKATFTFTRTIAMSTTGQYNIRLEYYSKTNPAYCNLQWSALGICKQIIPFSQLLASSVNCNSNGTGLQAEYFSNQSPTSGFPSTATLVNTAATVNFDWGGGSPSATISSDLFKARFKGYVQSLDSGSYTFYVTADDGIRLWINGQLLIDKWIDQSATEYSTTVTFAKCTKDSIRIEYYENGGDAVCKLEWSGPTFARQVIPTSQLYTQPDKQSSNFSPAYTFQAKPIQANYTNFVLNHSLVWQNGHAISVSKHQKTESVSQVER